MNILLHMCCAPCAVYTVQKLRELNFEPTLYFFNPNIHPAQEFKRRIQAARLLADKFQLPLIEHNQYQLRDFLAKVAPLINQEDSVQFNDGFHRRCAICYSWRLTQTAQFAAQNNFQYFTSTLLYSRHQNHDLIKKIAEQAALKFDVPFFYHDFRQGWQQGIDLSIQLQLYRQNYCGCIFSEEERFSNHLRKQRKKFFKEASLWVN